MMDEATSRFRPAAQQRGEDTRRRILESALELFATDGFEGAGTRTLAERAGVNLPAIQYYFGSKEGLFRAVIEHLIQDLESRIAPLTNRIQDALDRGEPTCEVMVGLLCDMLDIVVRLILDETMPDHESRQKFFARMEVEPSAALDALHDSMVHHVLNPCAALIGRLTNRPQDDEQVLLRAMMLIGQAKIFCSFGADRVLGWGGADETRIAAVQRLMHEHIEAIFRHVRGQ